MTDATSALEWDRIATLAPRLNADARVHRHVYRGVPWFVIQDTVSGKHIRLGEGAWKIVGLMNGRRTLDEICQSLTTAPDDTNEMQNAVTRVLIDLHSSEFIECAKLNDAKQLAARQGHHKRQRWQKVLASPVSQRVPLVDPQSWLDRGLPLVKPLFTRAGFITWLTVLLLGLWLLVAEWHNLAAGLTLNVLSPHNLGMMVTAYLIVKGLHELGHAYAIRAFGGEVHEMGVMFLVFLPVPYVDASASTAFTEKSRRMAVGAAGIMVELTLSVLALVVWLAVEPGLVRDFAFNVLLVAGVSTVLFNGNPLLRFDGYYVLSDAIEIPNLGARSSSYLGYLFLRYVCGAQDAQSPVSAPGERLWFVLFGITSFVYRMGILIAIGFFVLQLFPVVGVVLCLWLFVVQAVLPLIRVVKKLFATPVLAGRRRRAILMSGGPLALALLGAAFVPLPAWTYAEGVVWLPERAQVRAGTSGFLAHQVVLSGTQVREGDPLFALDAAELQSERVVLEQRLDEYQARFDVALFNDRGRLEVLRQQLLVAQAELNQIKDRTQQLSVQSPIAGALVVPDARRIQGRYIRQGELLAFVVDERPQIARVVVRQAEIEHVRDAAHTVRIKLAGYLDVELSGKISSAIPSALLKLPSAALGAGGGGRIAIDGSNGSGQIPAESVFVVDVALPADAPRVAAGTRVYVRIGHNSVPLLQQIRRTGRQLLMGRFGV